MTTLFVLYNPMRPYVSPRHPKYTREQLRQVARALGIRRGQNTGDTLRNLKAAGVTL